MHVRYGVARGALVLAALTLGSGCLPDLGGWTVARAGADGSIPPPPPGSCAPPVTCGECALPWLLASVEDLGDECGGQVWRWSLTGRDGEFCACSPLDAEGTIPRLPFAVGFVPPETVVVAAENDRVMAINGNTDTRIWEHSYGLQPVDIFAIEDMTGRLMVGVAGRNRTGDINAIEFYDAAIGGDPIVRRPNGDLPIGLGITSVSMSPFDRRWFRALKSNGGYAAADVDPWTNVAYTDPPHTLSRDGFFLHSLHASFDGTFHRTVWTGERSDLDERPSGIYRFARSADMGDNRVPLRERCQEFPDGLDYDVTCEYLHAVADPQLNTSSIAVCQHGPGERRIVRVHSHGGCYTIVEQSAVYADARISRLGLAQTTFWP